MFPITSGFISKYFYFIQGILSKAISPPYLTPLSLIAALLLFSIILIVIVNIFAYFVSWIERKLMARMQSRHGPTYVGKFGVLQNLADFIKLFGKENIIPANADKKVFQLSIPAMLAAFVLMLVFIPLTQTFVGIGTSFGLIIAFMILSFVPLFVFLSGWSSGNKFASIGAQRSVAMLISYEVPLILVIIAVAMVANSYSFANIITAQTNLWFVVIMPIGFVIFFIIMLAEMERPPFDLREADSELIAGWLTDVSAPYYGVILFLDYARLFTGALLISVLFLGGYLGPSIIPPFAWTLIKVVLISIFIVVVRITLIRMRIDRVLKLGWLYLTPFAVVNLLVTFVLVIH
jgi:NADH-quinone oxidoreductase subunit H